MSLEQPLSYQDGYHGEASDRERPEAECAPRRAFGARVVVRVAYAPWLSHPGRVGDR